MKIDEKNKQKIGLLTYHHTTNFGSMLQTYALYKMVQELGFECEIIDYRNETVENREFVKKIYNCKSLKEIKNILQYGKYKKRKSIAFKSFFEKNFCVSQEIYYKNNINQSNSQYEYFLVGSDLVWDFTINDSDTTYMLDFVNDINKKIAFASSAGKKWNVNDMKVVSNLLNRFDYIGVREKSICDQLNKELDIEVDFVCDPTMLFSKEKWDELIVDRCIKGAYILCYMANENLSIYKDAVEYGKKKGIPVYLISYDWVPKDMHAIRPYKIDEFLSLIKYAHTIFTASYHGLLFSLYFEKNFYYYNRGWKSRMNSIATYLNIIDREQLNDHNDKDIDYIEINKKIDYLRNESISKLKSYLND